MSAVLKIDKIKSAVEPVAKEFNLRKVTLFGSYATGKRTKKSDVDLLVEFIDDSKVTLFTLSNLRFQIQDIIGKKVDLVMLSLDDDSYLDITKEVSFYEAN